MQSVACCYKTISLSVSLRIHHREQLHSNWKGVSCHCLIDCSKWSSSYKDTSLQFSTREERNCTLLTLWLVHLSANSVIRAIKQHFVRHEIPDELITDNGPQFKSDESLRFAREYGFTMVKSSPYYSRGNWEAESAVKIAKHILKKSWKEDPYQYLALLAYRNTLHWAGLQVLPSVTSHIKKTWRYHPYSTTINSPHSLAHGNIAERTQRSMAQYNKRASQPLREFSKGKKCLWNLG